MLQRRMPNLLALAFLFLLSLMPRLLWLSSLPRPYLTPDEIIYPQAGRAYVDGVMHGDLTSFRLNAEHPPLAKVILGALLTLLPGYWFSDIDVQRGLCAGLSSITCVIIWLHLKRYGYKVAFAGWLFASIDPLSVRYSVALLDVAATMFLTLSMYLALRKRCTSQSNSIQVGIAGGLAALCKYSALPIFLGTLFLEHVFMTSKSRKSEELAITTFSSMVVILVGNPLFWPPTILGYSGLEAISSSSSVYSLGPGIFFAFDWLEPALQSTAQGRTVFYLSMFLSYVCVFPFKLFVESIVPWAVLGCLLYNVKERRQLSDDQLSLVPWVVSSILFFWLIGKSRVEFYYAVMIVPSMTLLAAIMLPLSRRPRSC